ncbi:palmitoyl-acyl carrier protein thioesterase [Hibiscus syriacus]|uniref:Palmitoyl-acyl carrier protein thioesterase n=1 Tax=Hibiscus syriacus TaxID=106335 RepID=A0A6A3AM60_HIBSY|nr:palmitoyl-acyl carrier protein thioesterase [Hibiscus syriacus]
MRSSMIQLGFLNPSFYTAAALAISKSSQQPPLSAPPKPDLTSCCRHDSATPPRRRSLQECHEATHVDLYAKKAYELLKHAMGNPACTPSTSLSQQSICKLALRTLPKEVYQIKWDVVVVDGPIGNAPDAPGRMSTIYTASMLARAGKTTHVVENSGTLGSLINRILQGFALPRRFRYSSLPFSAATEAKSEYNIRNIFGQMLYMNVIITPIWLLVEFGFEHADNWEEIADTWKWIFLSSAMRVNEEQQVHLASQN